MQAITVWESSTALVRKEKNNAKKLLKRNPRYFTVFSKLNDSSVVSRGSTADPEHFVCRLYGKHAYKDINRLRYFVKQTFCTGSGCLSSCYDGTDMCLLPPCTASLHMLIPRANHQAYTRRPTQASLPDLPESEEYGCSHNS